MKTYSYYIEDVLHEDQLQDKLTQLGGHGWQLIEVKFIRRDSENNYYKLFFIKEAKI